MSEKLEWLLDLQDRVSGPGARIERQLRQVRGELKSLNIEAQQNKLAKITDPLRKQRAELTLQRDKLLMARDAMKKHSEGHSMLTRAVTSSRAAIRDWLVIGDVLGRSFGFIGNKALEMGGAIRKAISFREGQMIGMGAAFGGSGGGVLGRMLGIAGATGTHGEQTAEWGKALGLAGVKQQHVDAMVRRAAGLENIKMGAGGAFVGAIANVFSRGRAGAGDVDALAGAGLRPEAMYEAISERFSGVKNRIAGQMIAGQETGIGKNLFTRMALGLADERGALTAARQGGQTTEGLVNRIETNLDAMFGKLAKSSGVVAFRNVLRNLGDIFNPKSEAGQRMMGVLDHFSAIMAKALEPLTGPEGKRNMEAFFTSLAAQVEKAIPGLLTLVKSAAFLGKWGLLKPAEGYGYASDGAALSGMTMDQLVAGNLNAVNDNPWAALTAEAKDRVRRGGRTLGPYTGGTPYQQFSAPVVNITVHAPGATKDDAKTIADKVGDVFRIWGASMGVEQP